MNRTVIYWVLALCFTNVFALAETSERVQVRLKTLLVSIEHYDMAPLAYGQNDIKELSTLIQLRYGGQSQAVIDQPAGISSTSEGPDSYKVSVEEKIKEWCESLVTEDLAILYLAGHGVSNSDGELFLPMVNFDGTNFETAAIPMEWIREQLERSASQCKLILLDTCFAGKEKSANPFAAADAERMAGVFGELPGVATLASSRGDQKSWLWRDREHSLFTYWVIEAFKGNADLDGDQVITITELFDYLDEQVYWISSEEAAQSPPGMEPQNPVILNAEAVEKSFRLPMQARRLNEVIENIADQLDLAIRRTGSETVMVPEFVTGDGMSMEPEYGSLPKNLAKQLEDALAVRSHKMRSDQYNVLTANATGELLAGMNLTPGDLATTKTKELEYDGEKIRFIVSGRIKRSENSTLMVHVELFDAASKRKLTAARGSALMNESDFAQMGSSFINPKRQRPAPRPLANNEPNEFVMVSGAGLTTEENMNKIEEIETAVTRPHPMADQSLPFEVEIYTHPAGSKSNSDYRPRPGKLIGNDYYVPIDLGEEYAILLSNKQQEEVFVRVLVDGLNTLSQRRQVISGAKFAIVPTSASGPGQQKPNDPQKPNEPQESSEPQKPDTKPHEPQEPHEPQKQQEQGEWEYAPRVDLDEARPWVIYGTKPPQNKPVRVAIKGFYDKNEEVRGDDSVYCFKYVDADESLAARKHYTKQLGLITVAFYRPTAKGQQRGGTGIGRSEKLTLDEYTGSNRLGDLIVIYNIRYVSREEFDNLAQEDSFGEE